MRRTEFVNLHRADYEHSRVIEGIAFNQPFFVVKGNRSRFRVLRQQHIVKDGRVVDQLFAEGRACSVDYMTFGAKEHLSRIGKGNIVEVLSEILHIYV